MRLLLALAAVIGLSSYAEGTTSFSVGHASGVGRGGKIRFRNVLTDVGFGWNYYRSHFECTEPGLYLVTFHGLSRQRAPLTLHLYRNYREVAAGFGDGGGYNTASNSVILRLERGDTVSLHVISGRLHESALSSRNYNTLSGFRVSEGLAVAPQGPQGPQGPFHIPGRPGGGRPFSRPAGGRPVPEAADAPPLPRPQEEQGPGGEDQFVALSGETDGP